MDQEFFERIGEAKELLGYSKYTKKEDIPPDIWEYIIIEARQIDINCYYVKKQEKREMMRFRQKLNELGFENYKAYVSSDHFKDLKNQILYNSPKCIDCSSKAITIHHISYKHLGTEKESKDIVPICRKCHFKRHFDKNNGECPLCGSYNEVKPNAYGYNLCAACRTELNPPFSVPQEEIGGRDRGWTKIH